MKNLFSVKYNSDKGSEYRPAEHTYINYVDFLDECEGIGVLDYVGYHFCVYVDADHVLYDLSYPLPNINN